MKKILSILFLIISITSRTQADDDAGISIDCTIGKVNYVFFNQLLSCTAGSKFKITEKGIKVSSVCGVTNTTGVKVFYALSKVVRYIPKNLEVVFPDLTGFRLESTQLKMVTKEDLQPFPGLLMFASVSNHIEFLQEDLFEFNTKLEYVSFRANKITYIHPNFFNPISVTLKQLYMDAQSINCGIGNPTTLTAIEKALTKFKESSLCIDISNASPLYILWLELTAGGSGGGSEELDACNTELETVRGELTAAQGEADSCRAQLESATGVCSGIEETINELIGVYGVCCADHPTSCPTFQPLIKKLK